MKKLNDEKTAIISGGGFWSAFFVIAAVVDAIYDTASGVVAGWNSYTPGPRRAGHH
jgi:peptide methionine sulfoxide reductase MsrA